MYFLRQYEHAIISSFAFVSFLITPSPSKPAPAIGPPPPSPRLPEKRIPRRRTPRRASGGSCLPPARRRRVFQRGGNYAASLPFFTPFKIRATLAIEIPIAAAISRCTFIDGANGRADDAGVRILEPLAGQFDHARVGLAGAMSIPRHHRYPHCPPLFCGSGVAGRRAALLGASRYPRVIARSNQLSSLLIVAGATFSCFRSSGSAAGRQSSPTLSSRG